MHLIDKHMYPKNFFFAITKDGIDGRRSLLQEPGHHRRRSSISIAGAGSSSADHRPRQPGPDQDAGQAETGAASSADGQSGSTRAETVEKGNPEAGAREVRDTEMDDLAGAMSALQFVPPSVRFGRGGGKAGFSKR